LGDKVDCPTGRAAAGLIVERLVPRIAETKELEPLRVYALIIAQLADKFTNGSARTAAQAIVERSIAIITQQTDNDNLGQSPAFGISIPADASDAQRARLTAILERVTAAFTRPNESDQSKVHEKMPGLWTFATTIKALAKEIDAAAANELIQKLASCIANKSKDNDDKNHRACADAIQALADKADVDTATVVIDYLISCIADTENIDRLWAYANIIHALSDKLSRDIACSSARTVVDRLISVLTKHPRLSMDKFYYEPTIRGLSAKIDSDTARAMIPLCISAIDNLPSDDVKHVIRGLAHSVDTSAACATVEYSMSRIAETIDASKLRAYEVAIQALAQKLDGKTARAVMEQSVCGIVQTKDPDQLRAYATAIVSVQAYMPLKAWIFAASETLKHPFAGLEDITEKLEKALGSAVGLPQTDRHSLWAVVGKLEDCEPCLPLSRSWLPTAALVAEFRQVLDGGSPLLH